MNEEWRDVRGFSKYEVSNLGNFRHKKHKRILKQHKDRLGYLRIGLQKDTRGIADKNGTIRNNKHSISHRHVARAFLPGFDELLEVDHINRNRDDNHVNNLRMMTRQDNLSRRFLYLITPEVVDTVLLLNNNGLSIKEITDKINEDA